MKSAFSFTLHKTLMRCQGEMIIVGNLKSYLYMQNTVLLKMVVESNFSITGALEADKRRVIIIAKPKGW